MVMVIGLRQRIIEETDNSGSVAIELSDDDDGAEAKQAEPGKGPSKEALEKLTDYSR